MAGQVTLFAEPNFEGAWVVITQAVADFGTLHFHDKVRSAKVEGATWAFYSSPNFQGKRVTLPPGDHAELGLSDLGDVISSLCSLLFVGSPTDTDTRIGGDDSRLWLEGKRLGELWEEQKKKKEEAAQEHAPAPSDTQPDVHSTKVVGQDHSMFALFLAKVKKALGLIKTGEA